MDDVVEYAAKAPYTISCVPPASSVNGPTDCKNLLSPGSLT